MHTRVLPGAVKRLLGAADWLDFHLSVYLSSSDELIISDDGKLVQILPCKANSVCIHPKTGFMGVTTDHNFILYEPVVVYGQKVYWVFAYETDLLLKCSILLKQAQWLDDKLLLIASNQSLILWDSRSQEILSINDISVDSLESCVNSGEVVVFSHSIPKLIVFSNYPQCQTDFYVVDLGKSLPKSCNFIDNGLLVVTAEENTTLVYNQAQLILSIPSNCAVYKPANVTQQHFNVEITGQPVFSVDYQGTEPVVTTKSEVSSLPAADKSEAVSTGSRIYRQNGYSLDIFAAGGDLVASISGLPTSHSSCIAVSLSRALLGSNIIDDNMNFLSSTDENSPVLACFTDGSLCIVDDHNEMVWLNASKKTHSVQLASSPLSLGSLNDSQVCAVFSNSLEIFKNGQQVKKVEHDGISGASIDGSGSLVALFAGSELEIRDQKLDTVASYATQYDIGAVAPSIANRSVVVAGTDSKTFEYLSLDDTSLRGLEFSVDNPIHAIKWNGDSSLVGVLTSHSLAVYQTASILKGGLEPIGKITEPFEFLGPQTKFDWFTKNQIILFDGKQVWHSEDFQPRESASRLPLFHPWSLALLAQALKPHLVELICMKLSNELKFCDTTDEGVASIDPQLKIKDLKPFDRSFKAGNFDTSSLLTQFGKYKGISGLSDSEYDQLGTLVSCVREIGRLDPYAFSALILHNVFKLTTNSWIYAYFSSTKLELKSLITQKWHVWLDIEPLKEEVEQQAKIEFARNRDPTTVTLYYLALHKLQVVQTLWRIAGGHAEKEKTIKLLKNDFTTPRWQSAALKNAYALLSKHRESYAAAFFLLGDSLVDCCQLIVSKMDDMSLAFVIARVYDQGKKYRETISALRDQFADSGDQWISLWCSILLDEELELESAVSPSAILVGLLFAGKIDQNNARSRLVSAGLGDSLAAIVSEIEPVRTPAPQSNLDTEPEDTTVEPEVEEETQEEHQQEDALENRGVPANLKPPPPEIQLEPDMSAFGF